MDIEFISARAIEKESDKIEYILNALSKKEKVLVLQYALTPTEEKRLITETMARIDEKFNGIEVSTLNNVTNNSLKQKIMDILGVRTSGITIVGPSNIVKKIKKNPEIVKISIADTDD